MDQDLIVTFTAFELAEEHACKGYLTARKDMVAKARRAASLEQLVTEQPHRRDYHEAWLAAVGAHHDAVQRTRLAYGDWQRAQQRTNCARPAPALLSATSNSAADVVGEVA